VTLELKSTSLLGRYSHQLRKICAGAKTVYSRAEFFFIIELYFASEFFVSVRGTFIGAYPDKEVQNNTTMRLHRVITRFKDTGCVCVRNMFGVAHCWHARDCSFQHERARPSLETQLLYYKRTLLGLSGHHDLHTSEFLKDTIHSNNPRSSLEQLKQYFANSCEH
jgi:hypothetical protein